MSEAAEKVLQTRGKTTDLDAYVVKASFDRAGTACAFALGDGTVAIKRLASDDWQRVQTHEGAILSLATDAAPQGWVTGGDDGHFMRIGGDGAISLIAPINS